MVNIFYFLLICIFLILFIQFRNLTKGFAKSLIATAICSLIILKIILDPKLCIDSTILGAKLFFNSVFPSLFPFLIISNIMLSYDGVYVYSLIFGNILCRPLRLPKQASFSIIISMLCGYPLGAKYACELYEKKIIDIETCNRLVNIASNASPLFIIGSVGTSMLKSPAIGYTLLGANYISCILMGVITSPKKSVGTIYTFTNENYDLKNNNKKNIGEILRESLEKALITTLSIGSFIVIFSVIITIIKNNTFFYVFLDKFSKLLGISKDIPEALLLGTIEMTNGSYLITSASVNTWYKIFILGFLLAFSGISIISQVYSFTYKYKLSIKSYIAKKALQGLLGALLSVILYRLLSYTPILSAETFMSFSNKSNSIFFALSIIILITPYLFYNCKKLFDIS